MNNEITNTNVRNNSTLDINFNVDEVKVENISLKGVKISAHADVTNACVKISADTMSELTKTIISFLDEKVQEVLTHKMRLSEEEAKYRNAKYEAETKYWNTRNEGKKEDDAF